MPCVGHMAFFAKAQEIMRLYLHLFVNMETCKNRVKDISQTLCKKICRFDKSSSLFTIR